MERREFICINCPLGCALTVTMEQGQVLKVEGNTCPRGKSYGEKEVTNPTRIVTTSVKVAGGTAPVVSVKTASDIPKGKIKELYGCFETGVCKSACLHWRCDFKGRMLYGNGYCSYQKCSKKSI